jgi:hypothetical protein
MGDQTGPWTRLACSMARKRLQNIPCNARSTLDTSLHPEIDIFLKALKASNKRFQAAFSSMQVEGQLLERIFYKGKNQHRGSLLWRRLSDVRKFTRRAESLASSQAMATFCQSFFTKSEYVQADINGLSCLLARSAVLFSRGLGATTLPRNP